VSGGPPGWLDADWAVADVAQPSAVTTAPSLEPGYQCHPCHFLAENNLFAVGRVGSGLIAVGVQQPPSQAVAFESPDELHWAPVDEFRANDNTVALGIASGGSRTVVVGQNHEGATAWSFDGNTWREAPRQKDLVVPYVAGSMTSVTVSGDEFVGGGYRDDPLHDKASAAVWRSTDGLDWRADDVPDVFAGGRIWGIASSANAIVAVGTNGDPNYGPVGAWVWTRTGGWRRAKLAPDASGAMRAVTATDEGFVAVGLNGRDDGARVWRSRDGLTWSAVPDQPAFQYFGAPVRMQAITAEPDGLVVGGWRSDAGKGSAVVWTSPDGTDWQAAWETSFSGGEIDGVVAAEGSVVAVGRTGYPDWNQATIWHRP
jgi:hypothetical protein